MEHVELQTRRDGGTQLTRVFTAPLPLAGAEAVERAVLGGAGDPLPDELAAALAGYRLRARLGSFEGLPAVLGAGVAVFAGDLPAPPDGCGYPYVTSEWFDGENLGDARAQLTPPQRLGVVVAVLRLLARLHARGVACGRLRPRGVVLQGGRPWLVELDALREEGAADDVLDFGRLATWLLDPEPGAWRRVIASCLVTDPAARPTSGELLAAIPEVHDTVDVPDPPAPRSRAWIGGVAFLLLAAAAAYALFARRPDRGRGEAPTPARSGERPFRRCDAESPSRVVVATIHAWEPVPPMKTIASWVPADVPPHEVEIHGVEDLLGRRVTFEVGASTWSGWGEVAGGARGDEVCWRVGAWFRQRGAGREEGARPDVVAHHGPEAREQPLGTLAGLAVPDGVRRLEQFLNPSGVRTSCEVEASHFGLTARCRLESTSKEERALRVVARLEIGEEEPLTEERPDVVVPPGETLDVPIPFERTGHPDEATCRCQAIPAEPP